MPIEVEKLREAQRPLDERIRDFLRARPAQAFTLPELYAALEDYREQSVLLVALLATATGSEHGELQEYQHVLDELVERGEIVAAELKGRTYYHAKQG